MTRASGTGPGERLLAGVQTSGRNYCNLSSPQHGVINENNVLAPMRDGIALHADIHRPDGAGGAGRARWRLLRRLGPHPLVVHSPARYCAVAEPAGLVGS